MAEHTVCSCSRDDLWGVQYLLVGAATYYHQHIHGYPHHGFLRNNGRHMDFCSASTSPRGYARNHQQWGLAQPDRQHAGRSGLRYRVAWL